MKKKLKFTASQLPQQQVFEYQDRALASIDQKLAKSMLEVFDQAWAMRLWSEVPMLPWRPEAGWKQNKSKEYRRELQNTFQLNALSVDMGIERDELAMVPNFRAFQSRAKDAVRLFDLRIGPPWWVRDRDFLESAYVASQEQEAPDQDLSESLWSYWGDGAENVSYWVAQSFFDHEHAASANVLNQVIWARESAKWTNEQYRANLLLNWQVMMQPLLAYSPDHEVGQPWENTFPHQFQLKKLIRLLNLTPRTRPERNLHAGTPRVAPALHPPAAPQRKDYALAGRRSA